MRQCNNVVTVSPLGTMESGGEESSPFMQSIKDHLTSAQLDHVTRALQAEEVRDCSSQGTGGTVCMRSKSNGGTSRSLL